MNREETIQLLETFTNPKRYNMDKPFGMDTKLGRRVCATNSLLVIMIPETDENKLENIPGYYHPNLDNIIPKFDMEHPVDLEFVSEFYESVPKVVTLIKDEQNGDECKACDGHGQFTHYAKEYDCQSCDGNGEHPTYIEKFQKDPNTMLRIMNNVLINMTTAEKLTNAFSVIKPKSCHVVAASRNIAWFRLDDVYIGCAGMIVDEDTEHKWKIIDVK